jgi:hypothetical protein
MVLNNLSLAFLAILLTACQTTSQKSHELIEINSPKYNQRLSRAQVTSQKVFAIVDNNSEISATDSVLLLTILYRDGIERGKVCYSYSPSGPSFDEYPANSLEYHSVFDIPYDYKGMCFKSRYYYDSLGNLRRQFDSVDCIRSYQYKHRAGIVSDDVIELGNEKDWVTKQTSKVFDRKGKDSIITQMDSYVQGKILNYKYYDWLDDTTYQIKSVVVRTEDEIQQAKLNIRKLASEIVLYKRTSTNSRVMHTEQYLPPMINSIIGYSHYPTSPDVVEKKYVLDPSHYVEIYYNKAWVTSGYYDSTIIQCDKNDSVISQVKFINERRRVDVPIGEFKLAYSITSKRDNNGLLISKIEDNHILGGSEKTIYRYEFKQNRITKKEEIVEWSNDNGKISGTRTTVTVTDYDLSGNVLKIQSRYTSFTGNGTAKESGTDKITYLYDSMGNKTSEKTFSGGDLKVSKEWKFNNKGLITEYTILDKEKGRNQKLVWIYKYV